MYTLQSHNSILRFPEFAQSLNNFPVCELAHGSTGKSDIKRSGEKCSQTRLLVM